MPNTEQHLHLIYGQKFSERVGELARKVWLHKHQQISQVIEEELGPRSDEEMRWIALGFSIGMAEAMYLIETGKVRFLTKPKEP